MARQKQTGRFEIDLTTGDVFVNGSRLMNEGSESVIRRIYQEEAFADHKIRLTQ